MNERGRWREIREFLLHVICTKHCWSVTDSLPLEFLTGAQFLNTLHVLGVFHSVGLCTRQRQGALWLVKDDENANRTNVGRLTKGEGDWEWVRVRGWGGGGRRRPGARRCDKSGVCNKSHRYRIFREKWHTGKAFHFKYDLNIIYTSLWMLFIAAAAMANIRCCFAGAFAQKFSF